MLKVILIAVAGGIIGTLLIPLSAIFFGGDVRGSILDILIAVIKSHPIDMLQVFVFGFIVFGTLSYLQYRKEFKS